MAVEMLGVRMEPSSFRWFNSVYHRWAGQGARSGDTDVGAGGVEDAAEGGAGQPGAGLLGRPGC